MYRPQSMSQKPFDPARPGPLAFDDALSLLHHADALLAAGDFAPAAAAYDRVVGHADPEITAAALYGLAESLYRMDRDDDALRTWEQVVRIGDTSSTYPALRQVAAARVRAGDLAGAVEAYREAEARAPAEDRPEIATRLGWLNKELGNAGLARRYFALGRGGQPIGLTYVLLGLTAIVSIVAFNSRGTADLYPLLQLDKAGLAAGEYWRLFTVTLLHGGYLHMFFNLYALYFAGTVVEQLYGWRVFGLIYLLAAAAGSVGSFLFGSPDIPSVGASGAIFGLFGVLLAASRAHHPVLDRRGQLLIGQIGGLIVINLLLGFGLMGAGVGIDNAAHVGGLVAGLWLGFILVPGRVPTLATLWRGGVGSSDERPIMVVRVLGVLALVVAIGLGLLVGTDARSRVAGDPVSAEPPVAGPVRPAG